MFEQIVPGLWKGKIKHPEGEWLIGSQLPEGHPGRSDTLWLKYWKADPTRTKYTGKGWRPPLPAHGGRLEMVQVLRGQFACESGGSTQILRAGEGVELFPNEPRRWCLPYQGAKAWGIALCRFLAHKPEQLGEGDGYDYSWVRISKGGPIVFPNLSIEGREDAWKHQLVVVYNGALLLKQDGREDRCEEGEYVFCDDTCPPIAWETDPGTEVTVVNVCF